MNLVKFWQDQVALWNDEQKCDLCWNFSAPLIESAVETFTPPKGKECCVQVLLLRDKGQAFGTANTYNQTTGLLTNLVCNTAFQLLFLLPADIGSNNFDEIPGHDTEYSKWSLILSKLEECIGCEINIDFCELIGTKYRVTQWSATQLINYTSKNYSGYRLSVNFQTIT